MKNVIKADGERGEWYVTVDGDRLDWICARHYGAVTGFVEAVLKANRGLADMGCVYKAGVMIWLPEKPSPDVERKSVRLWD